MNIFNILGCSLSCLIYHFTHSKFLNHLLRRVGRKFARVLSECLWVIGVIVNNVGENIVTLMQFPNNVVLRKVNKHHSLFAKGNANQQNRNRNRNPDNMRNNELHFSIFRFF